MRNVILGLLAAGLAGTSLPAAGLDEAADRDATGDRAERRRTALLVVSKSFCVAMRRHGGGADARDLRRFLDPQYLAAHDLESGSLSMETARVGAVRDIKVAADGCTVLCIVETDEHEKEAILLRFSIRDGEPYLVPIAPPEAGTGTVVPWLLRMPV